MSNWWKKIHSTSHAIAEYTSMAKRELKSLGLRCAKLSDNEWLVQGQQKGSYKVSGTKGDDCIVQRQDLKCECPDHTAKDDLRDWSNSNAGKFNPCKHIYRVQRDIKANGNSNKKAKVYLITGEILEFTDTPISVECCHRTERERELKIYGKSGAILFEKNITI